MSRHIKADDEGFVVESHRVLVSDGSDTLHTGLEEVRLQVGARFEASTGDRECVAVILTGTATVVVGGQQWTGLGGRENVFDEAATSVYVPVRTAFSVIAESEVRIVLMFAATTEVHQPFVIRPADVMVADRGSATWKRSVRDIVTANAEGRVGAILVGETIAEAGHWSSFPPHKHDGEFAPDEANHEEIYYYRVDPTEGYGVQLHYTTDRSIDDAYIVRDGDAFVIEKGYHPVVAAGGHRLYYLWLMAGPTGRAMRPYVEPRFRSVERKRPAASVVAEPTADRKEFNE